MKGINFHCGYLYHTSDVSLVTVLPWSKHFTFKDLIFLNCVSPGVFFLNPLKFLSAQNFCGTIHTLRKKYVPHKNASLQ